jgi:phosphoribosylformimino-5-aminoimidazole carboxamide ribotide isomerase
MNILPAIDLINGECVRLVQGDYNQKTVYNNNPVEVAKEWEAKGASIIHVVDLDGAKAGKPSNVETISNIVNNIEIPIQVGGGVRTLEDIETLLNVGVSRVILGSALINDRDFATKALEKYGEQIVVGLDTKNGKVAIEGWLDTTETYAIDLAIELIEKGAIRIIYTDIAKDGMMEGPNLEALSEIATKTSVSIIASGGVSNIQNIKDIMSLKLPNIEGCIIGKALYTGDIKLEDAIKV